MIIAAPSEVPQRTATHLTAKAGVTAAVDGAGLCDRSAENCNQPDLRDSLPSDRAGFRTADNFSTSVTGSITTVCWWGAYVDPQGAACAGNSSDAFEIRYFTDSGGAPGSLIASFSQSAGTLNVVGPGSTGQLIGGEVAEYAFQATHGALPVNQAEQYWIEITNLLPGCTWRWESSSSGDHRSMMDGRGEPNPSAPNGYGAEDMLETDLAFCLNVPTPPPPPNNGCAQAETISEPGVFSFDNTYASTDGPPHSACDVYADDRRQIAHDVWYCWTSPCTGTAYVRTCGLTTVDTRIAAYRGCGCPPDGADLLDCDDDLCGRDSDTQSMVRFSAVAGESYLLRIGAYPTANGGTGSFEVTCGPPDEPACGGTAGSCCDAQPSGGCGDEACCESVCACDPFCCEVAWDEACSGLGYHDGGCGAEALCNCTSVCGAPDSGDCCGGSNTPGCSNRACCELVCQCDPYCCEVEWDDSCATVGTKGECGAALLCPTLCNPQCPQGIIRWLDPPASLFDARRPHSRDSTSPTEGLQTLRMEAPNGADRLECWSVCETSVIGVPNRVTSILRNADRTWSLTLLRPITRGAITKVTYRDDLRDKQSLALTSHPGNVDADIVAGAGDVNALLNELRGVPNLPPGPQSRDIDRSGFPTPADVLELIDLLNGAGAYTPWNNTPKPALNGKCP